MSVYVYVCVCELRRWEDRFLGFLTIQIKHVGGGEEEHVGGISYCRNILQEYSGHYISMIPSKWTETLNPNPKAE